MLSNSAFRDVSFTLPSHWLQPRPPSSYQWYISLLRLSFNKQPSIRINEHCNVKVGGTRKRALGDYITNTNSKTPINNRNAGELKQYTYQLPEYISNIIVFPLLCCHFLIIVSISQFILINPRTHSLHTVLRKTLAEVRLIRVVYGSAILTSPCSSSHYANKQLGYRVISHITVKRRPSSFPMAIHSGVVMYMDAPEHTNLTPTTLCLELLVLVKSLSFFFLHTGLPWRTTH